MSQRELVRTVSSEEIMDWMAFDLSCDQEFRDNISRIPVTLPAEQEAEAIRRLLNGVCEIK